MKKACFFAVVFLLFSWTQIAAQNSASAQAVEISFSYTKQRGFYSNQFAVWIEDHSGNLVKTLFVTKFTATGGWSKRGLAVPVWVQKSGISTLDKKDIDVFSGATPRAGLLSYRWNGTDKNGVSVPRGAYRVFLEATLKEDNRVLYSADFTLGSGAGSVTEAQVKTEYFGNKPDNRGMITNVKVTYKP